jgi:two-component system response regulator LytT
MKIKIAVVEDEVIIADNLCAILYNLGYDVAEPASSYEEALLMIENEKPDLLLLDIQLKGKKDGIDLAMEIQAKYRIPYIFLTANADAATVQRAKHAGPAAYLVKPFNKNDLYTSIEICLHNNAEKKSAMEQAHSLVIKDAIFIREGTSFQKVKFADILYLESEHVYVQVHTTEKKYLVRSSMQQFLEYFDPEKMLRIHRSYAINIERVQTLNAEHVIINGAELPVSKNYREALFSRVRLGG